MKNKTLTRVLCLALAALMLLGVATYITEDDIKAKFENGVLNLMIPKKEAPKVPEKKQILIEG